MAQRMVFCPRCKRMVEFRQKGYRIYCKDCGREIVPETGSPPQKDSVSPEPMRTGT